MRDIRAELDKINEIVPFPAVVAQISSERLKEETAAELIVQLIETDAVLPARILRAANSPYYSLQWEVDSIPRAVTLLGVEEVSRLVLICLMKQRVFALDPDQRESLERLWKHTIATGVVSRMLALFADLHLQGKEFTAGLRRGDALPPRTSTSRPRRAGRSCSEHSRGWPMNVLMT